MSVSAVRELDRTAIGEFHIPGIVLMENAALGVLPVALELLGAQGGHAVVLCGPGNNGGDGLALARHLANRGCAVEIGLLAQASDAATDAGVNLRIARAMSRDTDLLTIGGIDSMAARTPDLVVDALFGTGLSRAPEAGAADAIDWIGRRRAGGSRVLSIDVPSGLDADAGTPLGSSCVRADTTVTLAAIKPGLRRLEAQAFVGDLRVAGIGVPDSLLARFGRPIAPAPGLGRSGNPP